MKRILSILLCLFFLMTFGGITVFAAGSSGGNTKLDTVIPSAHTITVIITGKGSVLRDGADVNGSITAMRHEDVALSLSPDKGYVLDKVIYNGEDVTDNVSSGVITLKKICRDGTLEVVFVFISNPEGDAPKTGDDSNPWLWGIIAMTSMGGIVLTIKRRKRRSVKG